MDKFRSMSEKAIKKKRPRIEKRGESSKVLSVVFTDFGKSFTVFKEDHLKQ